MQVIAALHTLYRLDRFADDACCDLQAGKDRFTVYEHSTGAALAEFGACAVLVDGEPVLSCLQITTDVIGKSVRTVEGMQRGNDLHPLQETFADLGAAQCGYCTPGILMVAEALLEKDPDPDDELIAEALSGNICRCTGYQRIIEAVKWAAAKQRGDDWRPDEALFMGHEIPR